MDKTKIILHNRRGEITGESIIDEDKYHILSKYKWYIANGYVLGTVDNKTIRIHRYIMEVILKKNIENLFIDHINRDKLDNRSENLRFATPSENSRNRVKLKNTSSKYIGVSRNASNGEKKWKASIKHNVTLFALYAIEEHAAYQYNLWVEKYNLTHSKKNTIDKPRDFVLYNSNNDKKIPIGFNSSLILL